MQRRLTAILSADVAGYGGLMEADEAQTLERLKVNRSRVFDPCVASRGGRLVKLMGDGALVEFSSVIAAVSCGLAIQEATAHGIGARRITAHSIPDRHQSWRCHGRWRRYLWRRRQRRRAAAVVGEVERAREWSERATLLDPDNMHLRYDLARSHIELREFDAALDLLEPLFGKKVPVEFVTWAKSDPDLDLIRDHRCFKAMLAAAEARLAQSQAQMRE